MDFSRMRLEPLAGVVINSTTSSNTTVEAEDSSSLADSQESPSLSSSSSCSNGEEETSTLPSGNTQDHLDPRKIIKKPDPPGQCAASEMENLSPPPIESFTISIPTNAKKKNDNENDDNDSSSSSDSTTSNDDISCLSSNASPIFKACRQRLLAERENLSNFYSALFQRHLNQSARIIQKFVRGMIQRRKYNDLCYKLNGNNLNQAILQLECLVSQFAGCCILPDVFTTTTTATATTEASQTTTTTTTTSSDHVTTTKFLVRPTPVRALSSMSVTTVDEARNLADQGMQDDDDDLNTPTFIVGGDSSHPRRRCVDNQVQMPPTAAPCCGGIALSTTMMPMPTTPISSLRPTTSRGSSSKSVMSTAELRPTLSSRGFSSLSIRTVESTLCSTGSSSCTSSNAYDFDVNNNNKATPLVLPRSSSIQPTAFRGLSTRSDMKILDEDSSLEDGDDFVAQQEQENDAATTTSCQDDNNDLFELDTLEYVCSFDNVYINVNSDINANDETALTTQGDDGNDDDDDDDSITHLSITKWLATEGLDKHHDDHDDETASTFADITDSSTDYDFLETIGNNSNSSASITLEAPPPPAECYFIPSIEDYAPVQKQTRTTTCKVQQ